MVVNCNSLVSNSRQTLLNELIDEHKPDIICGCESKLYGEIKSEEVFMTDYYDIFRKDNKKEEGAVFVAVSHNLIATPEIDFNTDQIRSNGSAYRQLSNPPFT